MQQTMSVLTSGLQARAEAMQQSIAASAGGLANSAGTPTLTPTDTHISHLHQPSGFRQGLAALTAKLNTQP